MTLVFLGGCPSAMFFGALHPVCAYCGNRKGIFRNRHALCVPPEGFWVDEKATSYVSEGREPSGLLEAMSEWGLFGETACASIAISVEVVLESELERLGYLTNERAVLLNRYLELIPNHCDRVGRHVREARRLGEVMEGKRLVRDGSLIGIPSGEDLVYQAYGVVYSRPRWRRPPVWNAGIPSCPRSYLSAGTQVRDDQGVLVLSTGGIYFRGGHREWSIPFNRLLAVDGYADAVVVVGNTERAPGRPQVFARPGFGWLVHNLIILLMKDASEPVEAVGKRKMRDILVERWGLRCWGCGFEFPHDGMLELDHNIPQSSGGPDDLPNRALLCGFCNKVRGNRLTLEGLRQLNKRENRWYGSPPIDQYVDLRVAAEWAREYVKRFGPS